MAAKLKTLLSRREWLYALLALASGTLMAVVNPPFAGVPDEQAHYWKAWAVASGNFRCRPENTIPLAAYNLPLSGYPPKVTVPGVGERIVFHQTLERIFEPDPAGLTTEGRAICNAPPTGYLPQALGLRLGALFRLNAASSLYLARLANLAASVLMIFLAIRLIPFGKIVLLAVGLLPMTIQQCASLNYDASHIALCFLFTAYALKLSSATAPPLRPRELALLSVIGLFAFNVKYGYLGLGLLVFLLPAARFRSRRHYWLATLGFLGGNVAFSAAVYRYFGKNLVPRDPAGGLAGVSMTKQFWHVVDQPVQFFFVFFNSLYADSLFYLETFLFKPGWLVKSLPPLWYVFVLLGMVVLIRNETESVPLTRRQRYVLLAAFLAGFLAVFFSLYLGWTKVGEGRIDGVQGRYLLGIAPLVVLFFYKAGFTFRHEFIRRHATALLVWFYLAVFGGAFLAMYYLYYDQEPGTSLARKILGTLF